MDPVTGAEQTPEDLQQQMRDTRGHMSGHTHELVNKVTGMVRDAAVAVDGAMHGVRVAVRGATEVVRSAPTAVLAHARQALDVRGHVRRHPWLAIGCAVALGVACARLGGRR